MKFKIRRRKPQSKITVEEVPYNGKVFDRSTEIEEALLELDEEKVIDLEKELERMKKAYKNKMRNKYECGERPFKQNAQQKGKKNNYDSWQWNCIESEKRETKRHIRKEIIEDIAHEKEYRDIPYFCDCGFC